MTQLMKLEELPGLLGKRRKIIESLLPPHMTAERFLHVALLCVRDNPELLECEPNTLVNSIIKASEFGLELDGFLGQAYLIPRNLDVKVRNNSGELVKVKKKCCTLMIGYRGYPILAKRSGEVSVFEGNAVYRGDHFEVRFGSGGYLRHEPMVAQEDGSPIMDDPGDEVIGAYCFVRFQNGEEQFIYLPRFKIERARKASQQPDSGPWKNYYDEKAISTAFRYMAKRLPLTAHASLTEAAAIEDRADAGEEQIHEEEISDVAAEKTEARTSNLKDRMSQQEKKNQPIEVTPEASETPTADAQADSKGQTPPKEGTGRQKKFVGEIKEKAAELEIELDEVLAFAKHQGFDEESLDDMTITARRKILDWLKDEEREKQSGK